MEQLDGNHLFCQPLHSQAILFAAKKTHVMGFSPAYKINNPIQPFLMKKSLLTILFPPKQIKSMLHSPDRLYSVICDRNILLVLHLIARIPSLLKKLFLPSSYFLNSKADFLACAKKETCSVLISMPLPLHISNSIAYASEAPLRAGIQERRTS